MKPVKHALSSTKRFGGSIGDYLPIHEFMDSSKYAYPTVTHRAVLHNSFGVYIARQVFGPTITVNDQLVSVADVVEQHILEDLGTIPTLEDWLKLIKLEPWMAGSKTVKLKIVD